MPAVRRVRDISSLQRVGGAVDRRPDAGAVAAADRGSLSPDRQLPQLHARRRRPAGGRLLLPTAQRHGPTANSILLTFFVFNICATNRSNSLFGGL